MNRSGIFFAAIVSGSVLLGCDPGFRTFDGPAIVAGLDLDGENSNAEAGTAACPHTDFTGPDGATGIDNQYWRAYGCIAAHQPGGLADRMYASGNFIREGIPMLVEITGVDDRRNDDEVEIRILSSADTVSLDANNNVIPQLSMRAHEEARYRNTPTRARIAATTRGYMCAGMDYALDRMADGHQDPETGKCTSLSGANLFEAIPAFVIMPEA